MSAITDPLYRNLPPSLRFVRMNPLTGETDYIDILSSPFCLDSYTPRTPRRKNYALNVDYQDGGEILYSNWENITETISVVIEAVDNGRLAYSTLELWIQQAIEFQYRKIGFRLFIEYRPEESENYWRSEILTGRMEPSEDLSAWEYQAGRFSAKIFITRRFYWEGEYTPIPLSNTNGDDLLSIQVDNRTDGTGANYIDIKGEDVKGSIPSPIRLEMTNTFASAERASDYWVFHQYRGDPLNFSHILEAEDYSFAAGPVPIAGPSFSNGQAVTVNWAGSAKTQVFGWTIPILNLRYAGGNWFRMIAFKGAGSVPQDALFSIQVRILGLTLIYESPQVNVDLGVFSSPGRVMDLGLLQLPPAVSNLSTPFPLDVRLTAQYPSSVGANTLQLDFVQLSPLDGFRFLDDNGFSTPQFGKVIDDQIEGNTYQAVGGLDFPNYRGSGEPIRLMPNEDQRLYILHNTNVSQADPYRTLNVNVYYRPRRITI